LKSGYFVLACAFAATAIAQVGDYLGPGVLSRGAGNIGTRAGQQVDLKLFANVSGVYDTGLSPVSLDSKGDLVQINGVYGVETAIGAYGVHSWRHSTLGLDYKGSFYHYADNSYLDGTDQMLALGYTYQKSRRLTFDLRQLAGTLSKGINSVSGAAPVPVDFVNQPTTMLFDNRSSYLQSTADVSYMLSPRTIFTAGGDGYAVYRQSRALAGVNGYNLRGAIERRLSRKTSIGAEYQHTHFDFPRAFGESTINMFEGMYSTMLGRHWTFSLHGGVFQVQVEGLQRVSLDPVVAALLGQTSGVQTFYRTSLYPSGEAHLSRRFKSSTFGLLYIRTVSSGNGVYLTSRSESGGGTYSYSGIRKLNLSLDAGYNTLGGIGQGIQPYRQVRGGTGLTYAIAKGLHFTTRYDARHQEIDLAGFRRTGYRATIGLAYSPGDVPLSLW